MVMPALLLDTQHLGSGFQRKGLDTAKEICLRIELIFLKNLTDGLGIQRGRDGMKNIKN